MNSSAVTPRAFLGFCIPGANCWIIIPIFTISFPEGLSIKRAATGMLRGLISMFRYQVCQRSLLEAMEFIRRYLQHVLPTGFMKIRYYGFMGSSSSVTLDDIRAAIELSLSRFDWINYLFFVCAICVPFIIKYGVQQFAAPDRHSATLQLGNSFYQ